MPNIDWTKPIETVPCARNPVPVPCEFSVLDSVDDGCDGAGVFIRGDWYGPNGSGNGGNKRDELDAVDPWWFDAETGKGELEFLPDLRNVAETSV